MAGILAVLSAGACAADGLAKSSPGETRQRYIVHLSSPPAALFEGFPASEPAAKRALLPTHPATAGKARLDVSAPEVQAYRKFLAAEQSEVEKALAAALGRPPNPQARLDLVLNALVIELSPAEAQRVAKLGGITRIEPEFVREPQTDAGPAWVGAPAVWDGSAVSGAGSQGAGVVIGIIDTGINAGHPSFAGVGPVDGHRHVAPRALTTALCASPTSPPCNGKLVGLRDLSTGGASREADNGLDVDGHGSHVSGIAAGNRISANLSVAGQSVQREFSGVAPHAHLVSYKACEVEAKCQGSWLLAAINAAVADGVDVINYSIGGDPRDPWTSSDALALLAAREAGIVPVVAAGNAGPALGSVTSPGNAPWVISVANASHNRSVGNRLVDFRLSPVQVGASAPTPGGGSLLGAGATSGYGPAKLVIPEDFPGCSIGSGLGLDASGQPDGSSNPWAGNPRRFNGEIVVCVRGTQARLAKGDNVRRAGAGGMVLINSVGDGEGINDDVHLLPAVHLGFAAGETLKNWLAVGGDSARIEGSRLIEDASLADRLAASSGRGPVGSGGVMLPSITAPGTNIYAAAGAGNGLIARSGTSMASPHVAGAAALLRALRPQWRVEQIQSALMGSARDGFRREDGVSPARRVDIGAGGLDVAAAARAQLALFTTGSEFRAARPAAGGQPRSLNLPGLLHENCFERCSLSRTLRDLGFGGAWRAEVVLEGGQATISPAEFEIGSGASKSLRVDIDLRGFGSLGQWLSGELRLQRVDGSAQMRLPLGVFASPGNLPTRLSSEVGSDVGAVDFAFSGLAGLTGLAVEAGSPAVPFRDELVLTQSPNPDKPYELIGQGSYFRTLQLPAATVGAPRRFLLLAEAGSSQAPDINLFVGIDYNANGRPDEAEELCRSTGPGANERCELELSQTGSAQQVWVLVQNHRGSGQDAVWSDSVLLDPTPSTAVVASSPRTLASGEPFDIRIGYDLPDLLVGERRISLLSLRSATGATPFARIPVELRRIDGARGSRPLVAGVAQSLRLAPGEVHDRLFIDLPGGELTLHIDVEAANTDALAIQLLQGEFLDVSGPHARLPPAPPVQLAVAQLSPGASSLRLARDMRWPQQYHLRLSNFGTQALDLRLRPRIERSAPSPWTSLGAWYNPARSGSGLYLYTAGPQWALVWFTYLEDGTPTWYFGDAPAPTGQQAQVRVPLLRYGWDGTASSGVEVGHAVLTLFESTAMQFSFQVDGSTGSERMVFLGATSGGCPRSLPLAIDPSGLWFDPANSGFGYGVEVGTGFQSAALFAYDAKGYPRWALASGDGQGSASMTVNQYRGVCPLCAWSPPTVEAIGGIAIEQVDDRISWISTDLEFAPPLVGRWQRSHAPVRLADITGCPW